jgi:gas vesicle protein
MTNPLPYLVRMLLFLAAVAGLAFYLRDDLIRVFNNTPDLDAVILFVLLLGIFFIFRQVIILWPEVRWLRQFQHRSENAPPPPADRINLLAPMAAMLGERSDQFRLSPTASRALLDGIATRLDERRELARYLIGLLIFLGLLGTFWGLLQTIGAVADAINGLQVSAGDAVSMFGKLKASIEGPLKGMSTAFGASLFGLSGSLVLGFLELQASQAQGRFHIELEEWLASATSLTSPALPMEVSASAPAYVEALLERNAEGLDGLARTLQRIEESRLASIGSNAMLVERLASLSETMRTQQNLMARFTELSIEMRAAVNRLGDRSGAEADREEMAAHHRNLEAQLNRLVEEEVRSRVALADELRGAFGKLSDRTADEADREALLAKQNDVEAQVAKLAEESTQSSAQIAEEVRQAVAKLSENGATAERELEAGMAKLAEDQARSHADLIAELRNMAARVADRTAAEADRDALLAHQRSIETQVGKLGEELQAAAQRLGERPADSAAHQALVDQQRGVEARLTQLSEELHAIGGRLADRSGDSDREALLTHQRSLEEQLGKLTAELRDTMARLSERPASEPERESLQIYQRNVEAFLTRLSEENARARAQLAEELNNAMTRMPDRAMAEADRESLASHQRNIESHLARLVDENARNRTTLIDELREAIGRLTERFAENDRDAVAAHQRSIEGHLLRLTQEATQNRTSLADELRGEIRLLARTLAISRKEG